MTFRVATWNLDHASRGNRPVADQIRVIHKYDLDIIVLTETCSAVDLAPFGYRPKASAPNKYRKHYTTIWSKWEIAASVDTYDAETATCVRLRTPFGELLIYGTILTWHGDKGNDLKSKQWEEHDMEIVRQGADWKRIQDAHRGLPLIVAGDFNQVRDGEGKYHSKNGIRILDEQLQRNDLQCLTDENFGAGGKLGLDPKTGCYRNNIDHICVSRGRFNVLAVDAWDHFIDKVELSDHNGVFVDLAVI